MQQKKMYVFTNGNNTLYTEYNYINYNLWYIDRIKIIEYFYFTLFFIKNISIKYK